MAKTGSETNLKIYLRILSYLKPYIKEMVLVFLLSLAFIVSSTLSMWLIAPVVTTFFTEETIQQVENVEELPSEDLKPGETFNLNEWLKSKVYEFIPMNDRFATLKWLCIFIFATFLFKNLFKFLENFWITYVEQRVVKDLREEVYDKIIRQDLGFFHQHKTGGLISNLTNDINQLNVALNRSVTKAIRDPLMIVIYLVILYNISWQITLIAITVLPITGFVIRKIGMSLKRRSTRVQERIADITTLLQETISGIKVVKAFAMEEYESNKFHKKTSEHFHSIVKQVRMWRLASPLSETIGASIISIVIWYGGNLVLQGGTLNSEDFIRFLVILFALMEPVKSIGELNSDIQISIASGKRTFDILDTPKIVIEKPNAFKKKDFTNGIVYENVSFRYEQKGKLVLDVINFKVDKNQKIAFVGSSGAGKTTLVNLLPRFYDVSEGAVKIDGIDVKDLSLAALRGLIGIVTQEVILFNDTVANNIAYGMSDYSMEKIEKVARLANAHEFIKDMPKEYNTLIGERGMMLSGGQRQRISIARAILKNPPILIFDEATSSLDSESEFLIQQAIENLMKDRTVFMIAHRLSSIVNSDRIIVLEDGKIVDEGTNEELQQRSGRYRQLYELQFNT
jgi:subfamily B ATP-binding cassette protein MsbA